MRIERANLPERQHDYLQQFNCIKESAQLVFTTFDKVKSIKINDKETAMYVIPIQIFKAA